jgi:hypothetical protein
MNAKVWYAISDSSEDYSGCCGSGNSTMVTCISCKDDKCKDCFVEDEGCAFFYDEKTSAYTYYMCSSCVNAKRRTIVRQTKNTK